MARSLNDKLSFPAHIDICLQIGELRLPGCADILILIHESLILDCLIHISLQIIDTAERLLRVRNAVTQSADIQTKSNRIPQQIPRVHISGAVDIIRNIHSRLSCISKQRYRIRGYLACFVDFIGSTRKPCGIHESGNKACHLRCGTQSRLALSVLRTEEILPGGLPYIIPCRRIRQSRNKGSSAQEQASRDHPADGASQRQTDCKRRKSKNRTEPRVLKKSRQSTARFRPPSVVRQRQLRLRKTDGAYRASGQNQPEYLCRSSRALSRHHSGPKRLHGCKRNHQNRHYQTNPEVIIRKEPDRQTCQGISQESEEYVIEYNPVSSAVRLLFQSRVDLLSSARTGPQECELHETGAASLSKKQERIKCGQKQGNRVHNKESGQPCQSQRNPLRTSRSVSESPAVSDRRDSPQQIRHKIQPAVLNLKQKVPSNQRKKRQHRPDQEYRIYISPVQLEPVQITWGLKRPDHNIRGQAAPARFPFQHEGIVQITGDIELSNHKEPAPQYIHQRRNRLLLQHLNHHCGDSGNEPLQAPEHKARAGSGESRTSDYLLILCIPCRRPRFLSLRLSLLTLPASALLQSLKLLHKDSVPVLYRRGLSLQYGKFRAVPSPYDLHFPFIRNQRRGEALSVLPVAGMDIHCFLYGLVNPVSVPEQLPAIRPERLADPLRLNNFYVRVVYRLRVFRRDQHALLLVLQYPGILSVRVIEGQNLLPVLKQGILEIHAAGRLRHNLKQALQPFRNQNTIPLLLQQLLLHQRLNKLLSVLICIRFKECLLHAVNALSSRRFHFQTKQQIKLRLTAAIDRYEDLLPLCHLLHLPKQCLYGILPYSGQPVSAGQPVIFL